MSRRSSIIYFCLVATLVTVFLACNGCIKHKVILFPEDTEPLKEFSIHGTGKDKILVVSVHGFISGGSKDRLLRRKPSLVQNIVSQLNKAQNDRDIKAIILKIDSSGGSVTASDMLYHEIVKYKERSGARVIAIMMGTAASGGYYIALPADFILAHPTSITGSIGVVFLRPNLSGLMSKIGLEIEIDKSGKNKDMGSPFRRASGEEQRAFQKMIDDLALRFSDLVVSHRRLNDDAKAAISTAGIYTAADALRIGLIDQIGYLDDAIQKATEIAGLSKDARVVVYHRTEYPDDNLYNPAGSKFETSEINLINMGLSGLIPPLHSGFYYLWLPGLPD